jgi:hypothetical protein
LISLDFVSGICAIQNQVHRRAAEVAERGFLLIQSGLRLAVAASAAQAGDGDWNKNSIPAYRQAGLREEDRSLLMAMAVIMRLPLKGRKPFCLEASPAKQKCFLCVLGASAVKILFWTSMN